MAEFEAIGKALQIDDKVLKNLDEVDKRINKIATDSEKMATVFQSAMTRMGNGAGDLLKKLQSIQGVINGLGSVNIGGLGGVNKGIGSTATQAEKAAASIAKAANAMNSMNKASSANVGVLAWQGLQKNIEQIEQRQKQLNASVKEYEAIMERIRSGKGGVVSTASQQSYQEALKEIEANKQLIASYREKQQAIVNYQQQQRQELQNAQALRNYESERTSLPEQRKADELKRMNEYYRELERTSKAAAEAAEKTASAQERAAERQAAAQKRATESKANKENTQALNAYNRAMAASEALVTQRINKIAKLRQAEEMLRNASGNYATQLNRISQEIARLNRLNEGHVDSYGRVIRSQRNLINTSQQLTRQLALLFSVSQIEGYISKLIQVRGEFELQQTALASILQNKDEADQLFGQITELAVRSPFTIKELTTYSKSLAAYQVQYEDLYGTLKMLADVSSGLGVDMQRLILAFGQVKAANFLRGTETRQFTEAGINMLGELSKYYSELEGRIVSVTEVQDRQFKRMISFQDVEEVFKRLTSAGGMFYNMQEKQAETLRGQMMNLQDQIDLMLNDIGKSNQTTISTIISLVKSVIESWRTIAQVMEPITTILVGYLSITKLWSASSASLPKIWKSIQTNVLLALGSISKAEAAQRGFNNATRANSWLAIGAVVATIIWEVVNAIQAANAEQKELNKALSEGYDNAVTMSSNYKRLANTVSDATASYEEQEKALEELKRTYGDILPQHYLEADAIRAMKGDYDEATAAIYNYIQAKTQEKQLQIISENEGADLADAQQDLAEDLQKQLKAQNNYNLSLSEANAILNKFKDVFEERVVKGGERALDVYNELVSTMTGIDKSELSFSTAEFSFFIGDLRQYLTAVENVKDSTNTAFADWITRDLKEQEKVLEDKIKQVRSLLNTISHAGEVGEDGALITQKQVDDAKSKLVQITSAWGVEASKIQGLTGSSFEIKQATIDFTVAAYQSLFNKLSNTKFEPDQQASVNKFMEDLQKRIDSFDATPFQNYVSDIVKAAAVANNVSLDGVMNAFVNAGETVEEYRKRLKGIIDQLQNDLTDYSVSPHLVYRWTPEDAINAANKLKVYQAALSRVTPTETKSKGGTKGESSIIKELREQIRLIQSAQRAYEEYRKVYTEEESNQRVAEDFERAFASVNLSTDMTFDTEGVITALEELWKKFGEDGQKIIDEVLAPMKKQITLDIRTEELDNVRDKFDELFGNYELTIQLDDYGFNRNIIGDMLNVDFTSIDDLQTFYDDNLDFFKRYGDDGEKLAKDIQDKIANAEKKALEERLKEYNDMLRNSISERARIALDEQEELRKIYESDLSAPAKEQAKINIQQEYSQKKDQATWEEFQNSDMYIRMFEDLESVSTKSLNMMMQRLESLRESLKDLPASDLKEIISAMEDIESQTISRNPFKGLVSNVKEYIKYQRERNDLEEAYNDSVIKEGDLQSQIDDMQQIVVASQNRYVEIKKSNGAESEAASEAAITLSVQKSILDTLLKQLVAQGKITQELADQIRKGENLGKSLGQRFSEIGSYGSQAVNSLTELTDMLSNFGIDFGETFSGVVSGLGQAFQGLERIDITKPMSIITGAVSVVSGIGNAIASIFGGGDNKKEKQIQRELELVENLQNKYEDLEKAIDDAYSLDTYKQANDAAKQNLENQKKHLQEAINLENDKKDSDSDRIKEWQQQIKDINEQLDELAEQAFNTFTGDVLSDLNSAADEFVDAWLEAFKEVGDGITGLEDSFEDMLVTIVKRQAALGIIGAYMKNIQDELKKYVNENDKYFTELDAEKFADYVYSLAPQMSEDLKTFFKPFIDRGLDLVDSDDNLSGLQKGIQSITEETAQALEALLNSIRFFSSDSNTQLRNIYNYLLNPAQENPFLVEMKNHTRLLNSIATTLVSMTMISQTGRRGLRVYIS